MPTHETSCNIETETDPLTHGLRREERIEDSFLNLCWDARSIIDNAYNYRRILAGGRDFDVSQLRHGLQRVIN